MHQPFKNGSDDGVTDYGNITVTARELASVLGLSEVQVYTLRRRNVIQSIRTKRTEFRLGPSIRSYIAYKCGQETEANADYHRERAKKVAANRELREILVQQTRDQLHRAEDVRAVVTDSNDQIRSQILAFGNLLALQVTGKTDPVEVKNAIDGAVRKLLNELREYKPRDYYRRQRSIARLS